MIVTTYIDEAGTHGSSGYMTMAGYVGRLGQWNRFDHRWRKLLRKSELPYFRSTELWNRQNGFKGWTQAKQEKFLARAERIIGDNAMFGSTVRLDRVDFENHYRAGPTHPKLQLDSMYGLCFRYILSWIPEFTAASLMRSELMMNFILEDGHENVGSASDIIRQLRRTGPKELAALLGTATPAPKKRFPGLQAADGLVSAAWQIEPHTKHFVDFPQGGTLDDAATALKGSGAPRFKCPIFRAQAEPDALRELRSGPLARIAAQKSFGERRHRPRSQPTTEGEISSETNEPAKTKPSQPH